MKLYRIKRISDGKFFSGHSARSETEKKDWPNRSWGPSGAFFKKEQTIKDHLQALCSIWSYKKHYKFDWYHPLTIDSTNWNILEKYEVETITIIDHGEKTQSAVDFMGIKEEVLQNS